MFNELHTTDKELQEKLENIRQQENSTINKNRSQKVLNCASEKSRLKLFNTFNSEFR